MWTGVANDGPSWTTGDTCLSWDDNTAGQTGSYVDTTSSASGLFTATQTCDTTGCAFSPCMCVRRTAEEQLGPFMLLYTIPIVTTAFGVRANADALC